MMVEDPANRLGWLAASRPASRDAMLSLKDPREYPVTFLWFSNGGRDYPPWNGRHVGVLGIEEGCSNTSPGHSVSIAPNPLSDAGTPTALTLRPDGQVSVHNVIGAVPLPPSGSPIMAVEGQDGSALAITCRDGTRSTCRSTPVFWSTPEPRQSCCIGTRAAIEARNTDRACIVAPCPVDHPGHSDATALRLGDS